eukprot:TRINITY_DN38654_c0_g1_i1.p1 TRINITY_DN38654_c0_g1~~TRINITY_DN38654_c0_g1_i1.p1  ORF type:complete len:159 (+),score=27.07 TRINITY_DN38654_c0_g1_i1:94-570(+)
MMHRVVRRSPVLRIQFDAARCTSGVAKRAEQWPHAWIAAINSYDIAAMDALCIRPLTFVAQGKKFELQSMGNLMNFEKMKSAGWRSMSVKDVTVLHGDETQVHVSATLQRHFANRDTAEETCSVFCLTKVDDDYKLIVGANTTAGGSTYVDSMINKGS